jgi:hypothetical protein
MNNDKSEQKKDCNVCFHSMKKDDIGSPCIFCNNYDKFEYFSLLNDNRVRTSERIPINDLFFRNR